MSGGNHAGGVGGGDKKGTVDCPSCQRSYELPKRYMVKMDEYDYLPLPRLLPCLHTVCHSCLEDQRQRSSIGKIVCPICDYEELIKSPRYLPLDISYMKQIIEQHSDEIVSSCSRCYATAPSVSWCLSCSSALCEFHHQDHKLSAETNKHVVFTTQEIQHQRLQIHYQLPPVACPESILNDCSLYCHTCMHLISSQAMIDHHKDHEVENYLEVFDGMKTAVRDAAMLSKSKCGSIKQCVLKAKHSLQEIDSHEEKITKAIMETFKGLQRLLRHREKELLSKLSDIVQEKRKILLKDVRLLSESYDDCHHAQKVAERLLHDAKTRHHHQIHLQQQMQRSDPGSRVSEGGVVADERRSLVEDAAPSVSNGIHGHNKKRVNDLFQAVSSAASHAAEMEIVMKTLAGEEMKLIDEMYLVNAASSVEFRSDALAESADLVMKNLVAVDTDIEVQFFGEELRKLEALCASIGGIVSKDDLAVQEEPVEEVSVRPVDGEIQPSSQADTKMKSHKINDPDFSENSDIKLGTNKEEKDSELSKQGKAQRKRRHRGLPKIYFALKLIDEKIDTNRQHRSRILKEESKQNKVLVQSSPKSNLSSHNSPEEGKQLVSIEVRLKSFSAWRGRSSTGIFPTEYRNRHGRGDEKAIKERKTEGAAEGRAEGVGEAGLLGEEGASRHIVEDSSDGSSGAGSVIDVSSDSNSENDSENDSDRDCSSKAESDRARARGRSASTHIITDARRVAVADSGLVDVGLQGGRGAAVGTSEAPATSSRNLKDGRTVQGDLHGDTQSESSRAIVGEDGADSKRNIKRVVHKGNRHRYKDALLGTVLLDTQIDKALLERYKLNSYFESVRKDHLPWMTVSKQLVFAPKSLNSF